MRGRKKHFFALAAAALGLIAASTVSAQITFFVSPSGARPVRAEGLTEATGTVAFSANSTGTIKAGSTLSLDYGTPVIGGTVFTTCGPSAAVLTRSTSGNVLTITVTVADLPCAVGQSISVTGTRVNANALGSGSNVNVSVSATVPAQFQATNPITLAVFGTLTVAAVQAAPSTTVALNPPGGANISLCNVQPNVLLASLTVTVTENFAQALLSRTDETGLGPDGNGAQPARFRLRFTFTAIPVGVKITPINPGTSSGTLAFAAFDPLTYTSASGAQDNDFDIEITATDTTTIETVVVRFDFSVPDTSDSAFPKVEGTANLRIVFRGSVDPPEAPRFSTAPASRQFDGPAMRTLACVSQRRRGQLTSE